MSSPFLNQFKLYFTSLFARTMPKVIIGITLPGYRQFGYIFTNISPEEMDFYEPSPEHWIHNVTIHDILFLDELYKRFPCLEKATACLDTTALFSTINKHAGEESEISMSLEKDHHFYIKVVQKDGVPLIQTCGELITEYTACRYHDLYQHHLIDPSGASILSLKDRDDPPGVPYIIVDLPPVDGRPCKCVLVTNKSTVSVKEFIKKSGVKDYAHDLISIPDRLTVRVNVRFTCPCITVVSVQPAIAWVTKAQKETSHD